VIDTVIGIKVRMSGLCINRYRPIIGRLLDYRPLPYRCISNKYHIIQWLTGHQQRSVNRTFAAQIVVEQTTAADW